MAKSIASFAGGGAVVADNRYDAELKDDIIQYIEEHSIFRNLPFLKVVPVSTYVVNLPRKWAAGIAVEITEGSEIPKMRDVYDQLTINLRQIGTGIKMTDEEQEMMAFEDNYFQKEAARATERLLDKENNDIREVMLSGAGYNIMTANAISFDDIVDAKTFMAESPYKTTPDMIMMSERVYADLLKDPDFKTYSSSGIAGVIQDGQFGEYVAGLRIVHINELEDEVYIVDSSLEPLVLVTMGSGIKTEKYRLPETREDVLDLTYWEKPAVVRPDAICKIVINRQTNPRKDYGTLESSNPVDNDLIMQTTIVGRGWDPVDGYGDPEHDYPNDEYEQGAPIDPKDSSRYGKGDASP